METIKSNKEISTLLKKGKHIRTANLELIILKTNVQHDRPGRAAFIAGKKLGNAVWRNRAKRRMRALYYSIDYIFKDYDVLFLAKQTINEAPFFLMRADIKKAFSKMESNL